MTLDKYQEEMLPAIEDELKSVVQQANGTGLSELHEMLVYHLGWEGDGAGPKARGKRVRPLLVLLSSAAIGKDWSKALPAAASVELLHNFSLIHDDIQDNSELRRGRKTIWAKWGIPQAINAGDAMFALAHIALNRLEEFSGPEVFIQASQLLSRSSLQLTQGQYLDLAYENARDLDIESYWPMVSGKTAELLSTCTQLGGLVNGASKDRLDSLSLFGEKLGLAFQVHDDILGIWGNIVETGKSTNSDLLSEKKSLPLLYALDKGGSFAKTWEKRSGKADQIQELTNLLEASGGKAYAEDMAEKLTTEALNALEQASPNIEAGQALQELALDLVKRKH
jgi:geranylgeranyl diphosphate synthase type I